MIPVLLSPAHFTASTPIPLGLALFLNVCVWTWMSAFLASDTHEFPFLVRSG